MGLPPAKMFGRGFGRVCCSSKGLTIEQDMAELPFDRWSGGGPLLT